MIVCKCCGEEARWCGDKCGMEGCDQITCDHCGMQYDCQSEASMNAMTEDEAKAAMLASYNKLERTPQTLKVALARLKEAQDVLRDVASFGNQRLANFNSLQERIKNALKPSAPITFRETPTSVVDTIPDPAIDQTPTPASLPEGISCGGISKCGFQNCTNTKGITSRLVDVQTGNHAGVLTVWLCELHADYVDQSYQPTNYSIGSQQIGQNDNDKG